MELSDFRAERFIFELRFARAWLMWDRAGALARSLQREFPTSEVADAAPAKVALIVRPNVEISFEPEKAAVLVHSPKHSGEDLFPYAKTLTALLAEIFEVASFTRVATRLIFFVPFDSLAQATERLLSFKLVQAPEGRFFNQSGPMKQVDYRCRWEGEATGVALRFSSETTKLEYRPAPQFASEIEAIAREKHRLVIDIDYFSTVPILKEQLRAEDWIRNATHMAHRDTKVFLRDR